MKRRSIPSTFIWIFGLLYFAIQSCSGPNYPGPLTAVETVESFELQPGFQAVVYASEPHVVDPVDLVFDEFGNAYAVEMLDYPYKPEKGKGRSRIRYLEDTEQ